MSQRTLVRTACPLNCTDGCVFIAEVEDGVVTRIRCDEQHPMFSGVVCQKAALQLSRVYSRQRILHPLRKRALGWEQISWNEAFNIIAEKVSAAIHANGPQSVFLYYEWGSRGVLKTLEQRFFRSLGGATFPSGSLCWSAGTTAQEYDFGTYIAHDPIDWVNARTIYIWGRNPASSNLHSLPFLKAAKRNGATIVLIDPVRTPTSNIADLHVAPRPGTDAALALGMANEIVRAGLADKQFIEQYTFGYESFGRRIREFSPEHAAAICDVPAPVIRQLAHTYAENRPAMILVGYGVQHYANGGNTIRCIDALAALTGNIGISGGGVNYGTVTASSHLAPIDGREFCPEKAIRYFPRALTAQRIIESRAPGSKEVPVDVLIVSRANPVNQLPNASKTMRAMESVPFKVVLDLRMSETAQLSDLVLPVTSWLEESDLMTGSWHNYIIYTERAIMPRGEAMHEKDIFYNVAAVMGLPSDLDKPLDYWAETALTPLHPFGINVATLRGQSIRIPCAPVIAWSDKRFMTPTGKFEFYSLKAQAEGVDPVPGWVQPAEALDHDCDFPFVAVSIRKPAHLHSQFAETVCKGGQPPVVMAVRIAQHLGIKPGDTIVLRAKNGGTMRGTAAVSDGIREDTVAVIDGTSVLSEHGPNLLTQDRLTDFGLCSAYCDCRVRIEKPGTK